MIYPEYFPEDRKEEYAEQKVFDELKKISDKYDIFYSKRFISDGQGKKPEYEIDFIIATPMEAIICLEVKGGLIHYNGGLNQWTQNSKPLKKGPDVQATSASHSLANSYRDLLGGIPVGWGVCFPDCDVKNPNDMPSSISKEQVIDHLHLAFLQDSLEQLFDFIKTQNPERKGIRKWMYEKFKNKLLRGIGFVQVLSTKIKYDENRFIELTKYQLGLFKRISGNKNIITYGPAGSGKTIVAKTIAQDLLDKDKTVLFMCFNRTLANKLRYEFDKYEKNLEVTTFHSLARRIIEKYDKAWWNENKSKKDDEFWNLDIPVKLEECLAFDNEKYDVLIIDEGQDFKELWFELIFGLVHPNGQKLIFLDELQNIFGHYSEIPGKEDFVEYTLPENCRNTKNIVKYLSEVVDTEIPSFEKSPFGDEIVSKTFVNQIEEQKFLFDEIKSLIREHEIGPEQILILLNSKKGDSCLFDSVRIGKLPINALDNKARMQKDAINYTTINTFKGLEADIIFIVDIDQIEDEKKLEKLYTEASRARHKLYLLSL